MKNVYTAIIKKEEGSWLGWIEEVPGVNCQEKTYENLKETLEITLREALEFNRQDAITAAGNDYSEEKKQRMRDPHALKKRGLRMTPVASYDAFKTSKNETLEHHFSLLIFYSAHDSLFSFHFTVSAVFIL